MTRSRPSRENICSTTGRFSFPKNISSPLPQKGRWGRGRFVLSGETSRRAGEAAGRLCLVENWKSFQEVSVQSSRHPTTPTSPGEGIPVVRNSPGDGTVGRPVISTCFYLVPVVGDDIFYLTHFTNEEIRVNGTA